MTNDREAAATGVAGQAVGAVAHPGGGSRWWQSAVFYQVYPRSFCDTTGNGVGDLEGLRTRLDHLQWLGVDAIWLSPFYRSPMRDYGYDVADFCDVDPLFGTLEDFDRLLSDVHERGMRLIIDWVPNHTSDLHPWFQAARSSRQDPQRDWYVWRDGDPSAPPNNWHEAFSPTPAWTWDEGSGQWYLHCFLPQQPDLNWQNDEVVDAMHGTLRFWLDRGVDGFRMDVVHLIGKDPRLADLPKAGSPLLTIDEPHTHELLRGIRGVLDEYDGDRTSVGEVYLLDTARIASYYGEGDELHMSFNFKPLFAGWTAQEWRDCIEQVEREHAPRQAWPTWVLSNHDVPRHRTRLGGSETRARAAAVLLLTLRGTPFLYAGEELGLEDAAIPADRVVDPGGRDGCRAPIPWDDSPGRGWAGTDTWLPWPPEPDARAASVSREDPSSVAGLYRRLLSLRKTSPALSLGQLSFLDSPAGVLGWERTHGQERWTVLVNFTDEPRHVSAAGMVRVASDGVGEGLSFGGRLAADQAVVLAPPAGDAPLLP
jgi:alpha-glucosidase